MHQACSVLQIWLVLSTRSCYLLWSHGNPPTEEQNHLHFSSLPEFLVLGMCRRQGRVSLCWSSPEAALCPPTHSLSCPRPWGTQGHELFPWTGLGKLLCQQMEWVGVLHLPRDQEYYRQWQPQLLTRPCQRNPVSE